MSDENEDNQDESKSEEPATDDRPRGFRLEAGLRPLSDLLGSLVEVSVTESPPPPGEEVDWTTVDESNGEYQRIEAPSQRKRMKQVRQSEGDEYLIDTRFDGDEFVVTADIPGTSKDDVSVGIAPNTNKLVIKKEGTVLVQVPLPGESVEPTRVWFNNGVLEVRVRPTRS